MAHMTSLPMPASGARSWQAEEGYHYTVGELADAWNVSHDFIRDLFREEADVVRWAESSRKAALRCDEDSCGRRRARVPASPAGPLNAIPTTPTSGARRPRARSGARGRTARSGGW